MTTSARAISNRMATLLVNQANRELDASRMYLSMDLWFRFRDYPGSAKWCQTHCQEEQEHAMKIFNHLSLRNTEQQCILSKDILTDWNIKNFVDENNNEKVSQVWDMALQQEVANTQKYFEMVKVAEEENDYVTREFLNWFIKEQLMEENAVEDIYKKAVKLEKTGGLYAAMDDDFKKMEH